MLVPQGTSAIMELSRANSIAEKLGSKSMLLPGVAPSALPPPDADIVEGLRAGDDTDEKRGDGIPCMLARPPAEGACCVVS